MRPQSLEEYLEARRIARRPPHWARAYANIVARCTRPSVNGFKYYGGRGIKCLVTVEDLRAAFIRDAAWKMKHPSVDRIDRDGHYEPSNVRWIEFRANRSRAARAARDLPPELCGLTVAELLTRSFVGVKKKTTR